MHRTWLVACLFAGMTVLAGPGGNGNGKGSGSGSGSGGGNGASKGRHGQSEESACCAPAVSNAVASCLIRGLNEADTETLMNVVRKAEAEQLPVECLCAKIEEGLAKQVPVARIAAATEARLGYLRQAEELLGRLKSEGARGDGPARLVENLGMALESGLPVEVFETVFNQQEKIRMGRIAPIVEAAEVLQLAGLSPEQIRKVLVDLSARNMNRHEVNRVVSELKQSIDKGLEFDAVYPLLWSSEK